ncbi:hypothetical protein [Streptomyces bluensis]|uniref:Uncharacterized protein n=1 Tax=Streptomyces bluensis TaxID=33897 RepID=A0ABW6USD3_9ACTN
MLEARPGRGEAGADTLLPACTGLNTIGARPLLEDRLGCRSWTRCSQRG